MRSRIAISLAGMFLLAACQVPVGTTQSKKTGPGMTRPKAEAQAAGAGDPTPTPAADEADAAATLVKGLMKIDAGYVIAAGGGQVISFGGGNVIAAGGGQVIAAGGGQVISFGGGNVIAAGGGQVIANGAGNFRTLAEDGAVSLGTLLPAKGMVVVPVSMLSGEQLGKAVLTEDTGEFAVRFPEFDARNIRLYAAVPGKDENDPNLKNWRFWYNLIVTSDASGKPVLLDEDTTAATSYLRTVIRNKMAFVFTPELIADAEHAQSSGDPTESPLHDERFSAAEQAIVNLFAFKLIEYAKKHQVPAENYGLVASRLADLVLADIDLAGIAIDRSKSGYAGSETHALPAIVNLMTKLRTAAEPRLDALNAQFGSADFQFLRPSDVCEFAVRRYFSTSNEDFKKVNELLVALGMTEAEADDTRALINAAAWSIVTHMGIRFLKIQQEGEWPRVEKIMERLGKAAPAQ